MNAMLLTTTPKTTPAVVLTGLDEIAARVGEDLGTSDAVVVTQDHVDAFAELTGDRQWIHVDRERAAASPLRTTIAHGYLTLSLGPALIEQVVAFEGFSHLLNYGLDRVRFPGPVPVGSALRARISLKACDPVPGGAQITMVVTFLRDDADKPVCVAETLTRVFA
jgi:acyl dehydratase